MKKYLYALVGACMSLALPSWMAAQSQPSQPAESPSFLNHAEVGVYADYFRFAPSGESSSTNFVGVGGRAAFNMNPWVALEGEMNYDFARDFTSTYHNGASTTIVRSGVRPITGLFGPKFQFGTSSPFRLFATGKIGFVDFSTTSSQVVSGPVFAGAVSGIGNAGTHLAFYPGGGFEGFFGPLGIRAEAGDEIYLNNGTYNNLRVSVGPTLRF
jgi:hypothetical protein